MIGNWVDRQSVEVWRRLEAVKPEDWNRCIGSRSTAKECGRPAAGCLLCQAFDAKDGDEYFAAQSSHGVAEVRYMHLSVRFGDARIGRLISARARRRLAELAPEKPSVTAHVRQSWDAREGARA